MLTAFARELKRLLRYIAQARTLHFARERDTEVRLWLKGAPRARPVSQNACDDENDTKAGRAQRCHLDWQIR
jgi:hypothetical protein